MYRYHTNDIGCFSLLSNSQDAPRRFKYANTGSGTKAICTSKWQYWSLCENSHDTRQSQRSTTQSITHVICSAMKTHGLHESTCHSHPPHTPSLSPQIRSPYPAFQINIKNWDALYRVSRSRRSGSKRSRLPRYDSNTQLATGEEHTHSPADSLDLQMINADTHTQINTRKRSMQTHALLCCNHIKCHMSSSSGICITASRSIANTTGPSPQMCVW